MPVLTMSRDIITISTTPAYITGTSLNNPPAIIKVSPIR